MAKQNLRRDQIEPTFKYKRVKNFRKSEYPYFIGPTKCCAFCIYYEGKLSYLAKLILKSFKHKNLYNAMDDLLYMLKYNKIEQNKLVSILCSSAISIQNNYCINFLDIWISDIYIREIKKENKFLDLKLKEFSSVTYITIRFVFNKSVPIKKPEVLW